MSKPKIMDLYNISKAGTWFVEKVCDWFFSFQWIQVDGMDIQRGGGRVQLTVKNIPQDEPEKYNGPWKVERKNDTTVYIGKARDFEGDLARVDYAIIGLTTEEFLDTEELTVSATGWVCVKLTKPTTDYVWEYEMLTDLDSQDNDTVYYPLAYVVFDSGKIKDIQQILRNYIVDNSRFI